MWNKVKNIYGKWWQISFGILIFIMMISMLFDCNNKRFSMNDFKVYYTAASRTLDGENLYRPLEDGHYYYKYSPETAVYFIPLAIFNFTAAKIIYWTFLALVIAFGFYLALKLALPDFPAQNPKHINNLILLIGLILSTHLHRELHLGQVNQILLVIYISMIWLYKQGRDIRMSALWAFSIFIKPHGLIFLPYFLIKRKFKAVGLFFLFAAIIASVTLVFFDYSMFIEQHLGWFNELGVELNNKQDLTKPGVHTIFSVLVRYTPIQFLRLTPEITKIFQAGVLGALGLIVLYIMYRGRDVKHPHILEMGFLTAMIPLLASTGRVAFAFSEIIVFLIICNWSKLSRWPKIAAIVGFVLLGGNWHDLLTHKVSLFINDISALAVGAIILLGVAIYMRNRKIA